MSAIPYVAADLLPAGTATYSISVVSSGLGVSQSKVYQLLRDRLLIAVRRDGDLHIPQVFFGEVGGRFGIAKHLTGLLNVLRDSGFDDEQAVRWMFTPMDDLGDVPAELLHSDSAREVIRRAQSLAF